MFSKWKDHALGNNLDKLCEQQALPIQDGQELEKRFASCRLVWTKHAKTEHPGNLNAGTLFSQENCAWLPAGLCVFPTSVRTTEVQADKGCSTDTSCTLKGSSNWAVQGFTTNSPKDSQIASDPESDRWKSCDASYLHVFDLKSSKINGFGWNTLWVCLLGAKTQSKAPRE